MHKVVVLVGSLRRASHSLRLARALEKLAADRFAFTYPELNLPLYNDDLWDDPPAGVLRLREQIAEADAALFVTPEHNRSIPAVVKNTVDWGSRPWNTNVWAGKPTGIIGTSPGVIGSAVAQSHLRSIIVTQEVFLMGQPEVYFHSKPGAVTDTFDFADDATRAFMLDYLDRFGDWIAHRPQLTRKPRLRP
jgi:chromate reductase